MDLQSFAETDFDPKKWINTSWKLQKDENKEIFVANTVTKLQIYMKQLSNTIDETTTEIVTSIPRVLQEAAYLQVEGAALQERLYTLEEQVSSVEAETGHSIKSLQRIDNLKSRLENAATALREADKWAQLATKLEDVLDEGIPTHGDKFSQLTDLVSAMTASLEVLSDAPDYEEKRMQLEGLYNRLEAALGPGVIDALTQRNADRSAAYAQMFIAMSRSTSVLRYWRRVEASRLESSWRIQGSGLLLALAAHASDQVEWLSSVLMCKTPLTELVRVYSDLLLAIEPSPTKVTSAQLKQCSNAEQSLNVLNDLRTEIDDFLVNIRNILNSERSYKEEVLPAAVKELGKAVFLPLRELLPKYTEIQTQILTGFLKSIDDSKMDSLERVKCVQTSVERSDVWLKNAVNCGKKLAGLAIYPYLLPAFEGFIAAHCSRLSSNLRLLESEFHSLTAKSDTSAILSTVFPAALALTAAAGELLTVVTAISRAVSSDLAGEEKENLGPLDNLQSLILDSEGQKALSRIRESDAATDRPLAGSIEDAQRLCNTLKQLTTKIVFEPIAMELEKIPELNVWNENDPIAADLPDFSFSPQEYITQIGQYLITLPQHLEPYLAEKPSGLNAALGVSELDTDPSWYFLSEVCTQTCEMYSDKILSIKKLDILGSKRCSADIAYLSSVVEDLGGNVLPALKNLEKSLRSSFTDNTN